MSTCLSRLRSGALLALVSLVCTIGAVVVVGEAYFRLGLGIRHGTHSPDWFAFHASRGWALKPGRYVSFHVGAFRPIDVRVDALGFRGSSISLQEPPGRARVTILGDSFAFAAVLRQGQTIAAQLEDLAGGGIEAVNLAVPGYGTGQQALFLEELLDQGYAPGPVVLVAFFTNDILDNVGRGYTNRRNAAQPVFSVDAAGALVHSTPIAPPPTVGSVNRRLTTRSVFLQFLRYRATVLAGNNPWLVEAVARLGVPVTMPRMPGVIAGWYTAGWEARWAVAADILRYLASVVEGRLGGRLVVAFVPSPLQVEPALRWLIHDRARDGGAYAEFVRDIDRPQRVLGEFCREEGVRFIDATPRLRAATAGGTVYFLREGHLNERGTASAARAAYPMIAEAIGEATRPGDDVASGRDVASARLVGTSWRP